jgi:antitoxin (DNA-binding transcriptional repressor) of toxin-antitoxin stability system
MEASVAELRYKTKDILQALEQNEKITILHRGKVKGILTPVAKAEHKKVKDHPFFGMNQRDSRPLSEIMDELRGNRFHDL